MKGIHIKGKRLSLKPVRLLDAKLLACYFNETKDFLGLTNTKNISVFKEREYIKNTNKEKNKYFFGIYLNNSNKIIGTISVFNINNYSGVAETGTMIGLNYVNNGYGTEAKHLVLNYIFNTLSLRKIYSKVFSYNERSRAYALKCGYIQEATLKDIILRHDKYWDEWILSITQKQWEPVYRKYNKKYYTNV